MIITSITNNGLNLTVVDLINIFENITLLYLNKIENTNKFDMDCKKLLLHFMVSETVFHMGSINHKNKILLVDAKAKDHEYEIWEYFDMEVIFAFMMQQFSKMKKIAPFPIFITTDKIDIGDTTSGETLDAIHAMEEIVRSHKIKPNETRRFKKFITQNGLTYIANDLIPSNTFKKLLY